MLVSSSIPNLINGVSQQPFIARLASQAEEQINMVSSVVDGLMTRPTTRHVAKIASTPYLSAFTHLIDRDVNERYVVVIAAGDLKVYDLAGVEKTVSFPNGKAYLNALESETAFRATTVADVTFVLNTERPVAKLADVLSPVRAPEALVWVRQGAYSSDYKVTVDGNQATYTTGASASGVSSEPTVKTDNIALNLRNSLNTLLGAAFVCTLTGSTIHIKRANGADFDISVSDSLGDNGLKLVKGSVQRFSDLPAKAPDGFVCRVQGEATTGFDDYYVTYDDDSATTGAGVWQEGIKGGEQTSLDPATMPHTLRRNSDGTFTFGFGAWEPRKAGDLDSVPFPSFVGRTLNDVFFHRDRLGFIADENVIMSQQGGYFDFFRETATQLLDTDVIDVASTYTEVSILKYAVSFNESLILFSDKTQFRLNGGDILSPKTASVDVGTQYDSALSARPVGVGSSIYFTSERGAFATLHEFYVEEGVETQDAVEATGHAPRYIPSEVYKLAGSSNDGWVIAVSRNAPGRLYPYKFFKDREGQLLQSSISYWSLPTGSTVLNVDFIGSELWLVIQRSDGVYLEALSLAPGRYDEGFEFEIALDRKVTRDDCTRTYNAGTNKTTVTLPYGVPLVPVRFVAGADDATYEPGEVIDYTVSGGSYVLNGNVTEFFAGIPRRSEYVFSTLLVREEAGAGGAAAVNGGRLQLHKGRLQFANAGYFRVEVTPRGRDTYSYPFTGTIIGSTDTLIGLAVAANGEFPFPIQCRNTDVTIRIVCDSHFPAAFLSLEWEGSLRMKGRRV